MGHRHSEPDSHSDSKEVFTPPEERSNPFLSNNDQSYLMMVSPFLSANAQKLISFFVNFGSEPPVHPPDFSAFLAQLGSSGGNKLIQELLPVILTLTAKSENKGGFDPSALTTLMGMFNPNSNSNRDVT